MCLKFGGEFGLVFVFTALNAEAFTSHISVRAGGAHKSLSCTVALVRKAKLLFKDCNSSFKPKNTEKEGHC